MTPGVITSVRNAFSGRRLFSLVLLLVSGVIIWRPYFAPAFSIPVIRFALMLHSFAAVALIVVIMVHIYAALWVKGTITAMVEGWVTSALGEETSPALVP